MKEVVLYKVQGIKWLWRNGRNGHSPFQSAALPTELPRHVVPNGKRGAYHTASRARINPFFNNQGAGSSAGFAGACVVAGPVETMTWEARSM